MTDSSGNKNSHCHLAWLIRDNPHLLKAVHEGHCSDGRTFDKLSADDYKDCP